MSFYTSLSGLQAAQTDMSTISHNLANVSTNGFKKSRTDFADVIASSVQLIPTPDGRVGHRGEGQPPAIQPGQSDPVDRSSARPRDFGRRLLRGQAAARRRQVDFTRNGSFSVNQRPLRHRRAGQLLQVYPVDGSGAVVATGIDQTRACACPQTSGTRRPTGKVNMTRQPAVEPARSRPTATFDRFDPSSYNQSTSTTIYDTNGNPHDDDQLFRPRRPPRPDRRRFSSWEVYNYVGDEQLTAGGATDSDRR